VVAQTFLDFMLSESQAMAQSYLPQIPAFMPPAPSSQASTPSKPRQRRAS
jgi:hypothetical protein